MERVEGCPMELYELMLNCWKENPNERKSFLEILTRLETMQQEYQEERVNELRSSIVADLDRGEEEYKVVDETEYNSQVYDEIQNKPN